MCPPTYQGDGSTTGATALDEVKWIPCDTSWISEKRLISVSAWGNNKSVVFFFMDSQFEVFIVAGAYTTV